MFGNVSIGIVAAAAAFWCAATFFWAAMLVACFNSQALPLRTKAAWIAGIATTHAIGAFVFYFQHVRECDERSEAATAPPEQIPFLRAA